MDRTWIVSIAILILIIVSAYMIYPTTDTNLNCHGVSRSSDNSYIMFSLYYNETENGTPSYVYLSDKPILANLTDSYGESTIYNLTTNSSGGAVISDLKNEKYNLTAYFAGDSFYKSSQWNGTIDLRNKIYVYNGTFYI
ncbi:MAG: hypothetical protein E7Z75_02990 [Methanobrevibacter olleyae]|uniref:Uncharacterized protein n=1 Tax=Methanobrevibacter olleyae TaxID=294671 RepID=A0A8T3VVX5_METOL|nr:hypothetical protein [Methanobrevibacter olleyae]